MRYEVYYYLSWHFPWSLVVLTNFESGSVNTKIQAVSSRGLTGLGKYFDTINQTHDYAYKRL